MQSTHFGPTIVALWFMVNSLFCDVASNSHLVHNSAMRQTATSTFHRAVGVHVCVHSKLFKWPALPRTSCSELVCLLGTWAVVDEDGWRVLPSNYIPARIVTIHHIVLTLYNVVMECLLYFIALGCLYQVAPSVSVYVSHWHIHRDRGSNFHLRLMDSCNMLVGTEPATTTPHTVPALRCGS